MLNRHNWNIERVLFFAVLLLFAEYAGFFIFKTSFVIGGVRFFSLFDDAMISMRYARNCADGVGLVWNTGESVEGYTNFLWTLMMSGLHLLPIPSHKISVGVQAVSALMLIMNLVYVRKIALCVSNGSTLVSLASVFLTAFYFPLNNWSLQGMEVGFLTAVSSMLVWSISSQSERRLPIKTLALTALAILTRTEMSVLCLVLLTLHAYGQMQRGEKIDWRGFVVVAVVVLVHTGFRYFYYGEPLPNTYYLKVLGYPLLTRLGRGFTSLWAFINESSVLLFGLPFMLLLALPQQRKQILLLLGTFAVQCTYSIYVGGDAWEWYGGANRYIAIVMPMVFILIAWSLMTMLQSLTFPLRVRFRARLVNLSPVLFAFLVGYTFLLLNGNHRDELLLIAKPLEVHNNERMVRQAILIDHCTTPDATIAVVWAGAIPYFTQRRSIDILGKSDRIVAHLAPRLDETNTPGHNKWDYRHSIMQPRPDVVVQLWKQPEEVLPFLRDHYRTFAWDERTALYFNNTSRRIHFDSLLSEKARISL